VPSSPGAIVPVVAVASRSFDTAGVALQVAACSGSSVVGGGQYLPPMGIPTDYFSATPDEALACAPDGPFGTDPPTAELKWVEPAIILGRLWVAVDGAEYSVDAYNGIDAPVASPHEPGPWVIRIKEASWDALASIRDDQILVLATVWSPSC
jgi:hypothetical protein